MCKEPNKMTPEQMQAKGKPLAGSAKDRKFKVVALMAMAIVPALAGCGYEPNQAGCDAPFRIGESEEEMRSNFPYPNMAPDRVTVTAGVERKIYQNPCRPFNAYLFVENGRLVGWNQ